MAVGPPVPELGPGGFVLRAEGTLEVDESGVWSLGMAAAGRGRLLLDDEVVVDTTGAGAGDGFFGLGSEPLLAEVELTAGRPRRLVAELTTSGLPIAGFELYGVPPVRPDLLSDAVDAAATADVAVVLVGTDRRWETEGSDRPHLRLPAPQDELVEAVAAANPRTVVVVNAGAPVAMPWIDRVAATLVVWFPGEEGARALAEVLTGVAEPSGRLPISIPCRLDDTASHGWYPGSAGSVTYGERCAVGYRHHLDRGIAARFPFGHGLGYSTFTLGSPAVEPVPEGLRVRVPVTNDGDRRGSEVVQVYADVEGAGPPSIRLAGFAKATIEAEATEVVDVLVRHRAFERWEPTTGRWRLLEGTHELRIGCSSTDVRHRIAVRVPVDGSTRAAADG
jgi:beta-glucosidase